MLSTSVPNGTGKHIPILAWLPRYRPARQSGRSAARLATILAPTDASLGQVVVSNPRVPARIRRALNVESGLNDGLSLPFLMLFIALARADPGLGRLAWIGFTLQQLGFGLIVGLATGWLRGWLLHFSERWRWITDTFEQLALLALALLAWGLAQALGGNGMLAAFVAGVFVKAGFETASDTMVEFSEAWGQFLSYAVFYLFGLLTAGIIGHSSVTVALYAVLSLTTVRIVPVAISLIGTRLQPASLLFLGWFGPRGLASVVLGLVYLEEKAHLPGEALIILAVTAAVLLSVFVHGISAVPATKWYIRQVGAMNADAPELTEARNGAS